MSQLNRNVWLECATCSAVIYRADGPAGPIQCHKCEVAIARDAVARRLLHEAGVIDD